MIDLVRPQCRHRTASFRHSLIALPIFFALVFFLAGGCAVRQVQPTQAQPVAGAAAPAVVVASPVPLKPLNGPPPRLIVVAPVLLPSVKPSKEEQAVGAIVRATVANQVRAHRYAIQSPMATDKLLHDKGLVKPEEIAKLSAGRLGAIAQADAVLYVKLTKLEGAVEGGKGTVSLTANLKLVNTKTGSLLWESGEVAGPSKEKMVENRLAGVIAPETNDFVAKHMAAAWAAHEVFRDALQALPPVESVAGPKIFQLVDDAATLSRKAGESVTVWMQGEPGMQASFDLGSYRTGQAMTETQAGIYTGSYKVQPDDNVARLSVVGHLSSQGAQAGATTEWESPFGLVALDAVPPASPTGLAVVGQDAEVQVRWKPNEEDDLAGYWVYRSDDPKAEFNLVGGSELPAFVDTRELVNRRVYYYKVLAYDKAGNASPPSEVVIGVPVEAGPTPVSGTIKADMIWYATEGPYVLDGDVVVDAGATLTIEAGTVIRSKGGGLIVHGGLRAKGTTDRMIVMMADAEGPTHSWRGLVFEQTGEKESLLEGVRVTQALVGVSCLAASPKILGGELVENGTGLAVSRAASHPTVERSLIARNHEDGVSVQDAAAPVLTANRIIHNKRYGVAVNQAPKTVLRGNELRDNELLQLWNAVPKAVVDISGNWWGTRDSTAVLLQVDGAVTIEDYLDGPLPDGKLIALPKLTSTLGGPLKASAILLTSKSPYLVSSPLIIGKGVILTIQAGVVLRFKAGDNSLVVQEGVIQALGTKQRPIKMTSANESPKLGDYSNAVRIDRGGSAPTVLRHVQIDYATTAVHIADGAVEVSHALIANNLQSAVECEGSSSVKISRSTLTEHANNAAVICRGKAKAALHRNNVVRNAWGVVNHSVQLLEARDNWWGGEQPDGKLFLGLVDYLPALKQPEPEAPQYAPSTAPEPAAKKAK